MCVERIQFKKLYTIVLKSLLGGWGLSELGEIKGKGKF